MWVAPFIAHNGTWIKEKEKNPRKVRINQMMGSFIDVWRYLRSKENQFTRSSAHIGWSLGTLSIMVTFLRLNGSHIMIIQLSRGKFAVRNKTSKQMEIQCNLS